MIHDSTRFTLAPLAKKLLVTGLLASSLVLVLGCGDSSEHHSREIAPAPLADVAPFPVTLATVGGQATPDSSSASGSLRALRKASPGTKLMGRVEAVLVDEGQPVAKGQLLARIESRDLEAAIRKAEAAVSMAEAQLQNASEQHERMKALHQRGSVTDKNLEDARAQFRVATAQLETARAGLAEASVMLGYAQIRSPLAGWLVEKHLNVGDMVSPGMPAFGVEDLSTLEVSVEISESQLGEVEVGQPIQVQVAGGERSATILRIVPSGNPTSRTFTLEAELDNATGELRSGMFARVTWQSDPIGDTSGPVSIASSALVRKGQLEGVYVAPGDGENLELRWVKTGAQTADRVTVLSGLSAGERYVLAPAAELFDGAPYRATSARAQDAEVGGPE